jgi:hypothetical protein
MRLRFGLLENGDSGGVVGGREGRGRAGGLWAAWRG